MLVWCGTMGRVPVDDEVRTQDKKLRRFADAHRGWRMTKSTRRDPETGERGYYVFNDLATGKVVALCQQDGSLLDFDAAWAVVRGELPCLAVPPSSPVVPVGDEDLSGPATGGGVEQLGLFEAPAPLA